MGQKKIVVAMSGGVDSSVAAALLKEQGYDVIGVTLKTRNWDDTEGRKFGGCCGSSDFYDARSVAQALDIPHYNFDYVNEFRGSVISYFKDSYMKAETPNPCIACNQYVKFDRLLHHAQALGADLLATGHYARVERHDGPPTTTSGVTVKTPSGTTAESSSPQASGGDPSFVLKKAVDLSKDQSYVLYHLGQEQLSRVRFPVGEFSKPEIREIARKYGLITADKPDSQEICFVPNNDYRGFIASEIPQEERPAGPIRYKDGTLLGQHQGLPFYTVGQRGGLGLAVGRPLYVMALQRESNTLVVGEKADVFADSLEIREVSWVSGAAPVLPRSVSVKIRYKHTEARAVLMDPRQGRSATEPLADANAVVASGMTTIKAVFEQPQSAVTPGQAAVFYEGDVVLGGGVIDHVID